MAHLALSIGEIVEIILNHIIDGTTYKSSLLVCRVWLIADMSQHEDRVDKFSDHLITILEKHPKIINNDNVYNLCSNPNLTLDFIQAHPEVKWNWSTLSRHSKITWDFIRSHFHLDWAWYSVCYNPNITWEIMTENPQMLWDWRDLYDSGKIPQDVIKTMIKKPWLKDTLFESDDYSYIPIEVFEENIHLQWDRTRISSHPKLTKDFITKYESKLHKDILQSNPVFTMDDIENCSPYPYNLGLNPNLTEEYILAYINMNWYFEILIQQKKISLTNILKYPDLITKCIFQICNRSDLNINILRELHEKYKLHWNMLTINRAFTWEILSNNADLPWIIPDFIGNPNVTWRIVMQNPQIDWNYSLLLQNKFRKNK